MFMLSLIMLMFMLCGANGVLLILVSMFVFRICAFLHARVGGVVGLYVGLGDLCVVLVDAGVDVGVGLLCLFVCVCLCLL